MAETKPSKSNASICVRFVNNNSGKKRFFINIDVFKGGLISEGIPISFRSSTKECY